jgi:hypothetical protein
MKRYWKIGREWLLPLARFNNDGTENDIDADYRITEDGETRLTEDGETRVIE